MQRIVWIAVIGLLLTGGCKTWSPFGRRKPVHIAAGMQTSGLAYAQLLQRQGDYLPAIVEYRKSICSGGEAWECEEARIGTAECLLKLHKYPAAVAALGPLPVAAASETDCHKLAIAGEALLRQHRTEEAECYLEIALGNFNLEDFLCYQGVPGQSLGTREDFLCYQGVPGQSLGTREDSRTQAPPYSRTQAPPGDGLPARLSLIPSQDEASTQGVPRQSLGTRESVEVIPPGNIVVPSPMPEMANPCCIGPPSWLPPCCANLGCAYLKNGKPEKAAFLYCYAARMYRTQGNQIAADQAQRMGDDLIAVIRQYAPFKPSPWMHGAPSGKQ